MNFLEEENAKKVMMEFLQESHRNGIELNKFRKKVAEDELTMLSVRSNLENIYTKASLEELENEKQSSSGSSSFSSVEESDFQNILKLPTLS